MLKRDLHCLKKVIACFVNKFRVRNEIIRFFCSDNFKSNERYMKINHENVESVPEDSSHAILTIESIDPDTNQELVSRYTCEYKDCSRTYSTVGNLRTHMKRHKGISILQAFA